MTESKINNDQENKNFLDKLFKFFLEWYFTLQIKIKFIYINS
jgi:hypothetical protein